MYNMYNIVYTNEKGKSFMLKKCILSLITIFCVFLCACGISTQKKEAYITLKVTINPEFEIILDESSVVLDVNKLNKDAKELFFGVDVVGISYDAAMTLILDAAFEKSYITSETDEIKIEVRTQETLDQRAMGVWQEIFERPVVKFKEENQLSFNVISSEVAAEHEEQTAVNDNTQSEPFRWEPNSTYEMPIVDPNTKEEIGKTIEYYDEEGLLCKEERTFNYGKIEIHEYYKNGKVSRWYNLSAEGQETEEHYDENGVRLNTKVVYRDGSFYERTYYANGNTKFYEEDSRNSGGNYCIENYRENGTSIDSFIIHPDGTTIKSATYENGNSQYTISEFPDGTYMEHHKYENGADMKHIEKGSDIGYREREYYSNGKIKSELSDGGTTYREARYSENGDIEYDYYKSGQVEYLIENGKYVKYKDGDYEVTDPDILDAMSP